MYVYVPISKQPQNINGCPPSSRPVASLQFEPKMCVNAVVFCFIATLVFTSNALARPQAESEATNNQQPVGNSDSSTPVPILSQTEVVGTDGSFNFSYETGNGITYQESGYIKPNVNTRAGQGNEGEEDNFPIQVLTGSYSYTAPDGQVISLRYIADENGFQPEGDHLPTPPPIPESVQRLLDGLKNTVDEDTKPQEPPAAAPLDGQSSAIENFEIIRP